MNGTAMNGTTIKRPDRAFILAAGRGNRLRPHTDTLPKPLVPVAGRPLIDHVIESLAAAGVADMTVNLHYMADKLAQHLRARTGGPRFHLSFEDTLLDTGGGIRNALPALGDGPFYVVSGDSFWHDGPSGPALDRLAAAWDPDRMDLLMLMQPLDRLPAGRAVGDYDLMPDGRAVRSLAQKGTHMWTSVRLCDSRLFEDTPADTPFSFLTLMDRAQQRGRLYTLVHDGDWFHITTPDDLAAINARLSQTALYA